MKTIEKRIKRLEDLQDQVWDYRANESHFERVLNLLEKEYYYEGGDEGSGIY